MSIHSIFAVFPDLIQACHDRTDRGDDVPQMHVVRLSTRSFSHRYMGNEGDIFAKAELKAPEAQIYQSHFNRQLGLSLAVSGIDLTFPVSPSQISSLLSKIRDGLPSQCREIIEQKQAGDKATFPKFTAHVANS
ncbi:unnamed protein product [Calypogeia fissa]